MLEMLHRRKRIDECQLRFRSVFLTFIFFLGNSTFCSALPVTACAIRWDAWYTNKINDPGYYASITLSPPQWRPLAPLHAQIDSSGKITWQASQDNFDKEIRSAHAANLCWAYLMYGTDNIFDLSNPLMKALELHLKSSIKDDVKFSIITTSGMIGRANNYSKAVDTTISMLGESNYQKVLVHGEWRPLIFLFYSDSDLEKLFNNSFPAMRQPLDAIRRASESRHLGNPYIVILFSDPIRGEIARSNLGADALSEYISGRRRGDKQSWRSFETSIEADWDSFSAKSKADVIPTLRSGADIRARCQTPPPYDHRFSAGSTCSNYVKNPSLAELQKEFRDAIDWLNINSNRDPARTLLIYSWSECDESGNCLMPTLGDPTGLKLQAVSPLLR